ncbi:hypothetical protein JKP88DRAFT_241634 [Tribonema minus]|uniref:Uncharacterized protein n=1 Tax=Tribonema minus TaxID=303371 RepID=A0A835Z1R4_9STRA|nr:hypothetical protein JKP88DRAFT_241634 [Tribonema minus]
MLNLGRKRGPSDVVPEHRRIANAAWLFLVAGFLVYSCISMLAAINNPADERSTNFSAPSISICIEGNVGCATSIYGGRWTTDDCLELPKVPRQNWPKLPADAGRPNVVLGSGHLRVGVPKRCSSRCKLRTKYHSFRSTLERAVAAPCLDSAAQLTPASGARAAIARQTCAPGFSMDILAVWDTNWNEAKYAVQARANATLFQRVADVWIWQGVYARDGSSIAGTGLARKLAPLPLTIFRGPYGTGINSAIDYTSSTYQLTRSRLKYACCCHGPCLNAFHLIESCVSEKPLQQRRFACGSAAAVTVFLLQAVYCNPRCAMAAISCCFQNGSYAMFYNGVVSTGSRYADLYLKDYDEDADGKHLGPAARPEPYMLDNVAIAKIYISLDPGIYTMFYEVDPNWFTIASTVYGLWPAVLAVFGLLFTTRIASRRYLVCKGPKEQVRPTARAMDQQDIMEAICSRSSACNMIAHEADSLRCAVLCAAYVHARRQRCRRCETALTHRLLTERTGSPAAANPAVLRMVRFCQRLMRTCHARHCLPAPQLLTPRAVHRTRAVATEFGLGRDDSSLERNWFKDTRVKLSTMSVRKSLVRESAQPQLKRGSGSTSSAMTMPTLVRIPSQGMSDCVHESDTTVDETLPELAAESVSKAPLRALFRAV